MKTLQQILNLTIDRKYYQNAGYFMRVAIKRAMEANLITCKEYFFAVYEIEALIEDSYTLTSYLVGVLGHEGKHIPLKIAIYKDWDNRHQLIAQEKLKLDKELSGA